MVEGTHTGIPVRHGHMNVSGANLMIAKNATDIRYDAAVSIFFRHRRRSADVEGRAGSDHHDSTQPGRGTHHRAEVRQVGRCGLHVGMTGVDVGHDRCRPFNLTGQELAGDAAGDAHCRGEII